MPLPIFCFLIEDAVRSAELTDLSAVEIDLVRHRSDLLARWGAIWYDLDAAIDPAFDGGKPHAPLRNDAPGARMADADWSNLQNRLIYIEQRAIESFGRFLKRYYTRSLPDRVEFEEVVASASLTPERINRMRRQL